VLKGFSSAGVIEIKENDGSGTYRVVYMIKVSEKIFVLHAFQKKSKQGIKTPKREIDLINKRIREALELYKDHGK
jgi:phage-related protein